jgi:hypothetical protein
MRRIRAIRRSAAGVVIAAMPAMPVMHKEVHQRAGEQKQPGKPGNHQPEMRPMLGEEKEPAEDEKADENDVGPRGEEALVLAIVIAMIHYGLVVPLDRPM